MHPVDMLAFEISKRLLEAGVSSSCLVDGQRTTPMMRYERGLYIAKQSPRLTAIGNALMANSPWALDAVDALAAHALTVLNVALADVTDATEAHALGALLNLRRPRSR